MLIPLNEEKVILKYKVNAFFNTDLNEYLVANEITDLVLVGMQTHLFLEAATCAASYLGYKCTVIGNACATRDLSFGGQEVKAKDVKVSTLATLSSYAKVVDANTYFETEKSKSKH